MAAIFIEGSYLFVFTFCLYSAYLSVSIVRCDLHLTGISPVDDTGSIKDGVVEITSDKPVLLRLYGVGFSEETRVSFTLTPAKSSEICDADRTKPLEFQQDGLHEYKGEVEVSLPGASASAPYYVCLQAGNGSEWLHQGASDKLLQISTVAASKEMLPLWVRIAFIVVLMMLSGIFSGLNLGLMALDPFELKIVMNSGKPNEQEYAKTIEPVRRHGNYLLCTLLLGNVLVNTSFTVLLDGIIGNGMAAVLGSTAGIVIFGEIVPQSICSRNGLAVGSRTIWLTKFFMLITFPISYPISKILDCVLGNEIGTVYNRQQLLEMLKVTAAYNDLEGDEMEIISGVLNYKRKTVEEVMTKLDDCFLLDVSCVLDFRTIASIMESGHSRIPVYEQERYNIVGLLFVKDLAFVDSEDCTPLRTVIKFYKHKVQRVFYDVHLDRMLEDFKTGQSHLAIVQRVNNQGEGDPYYEAIGIVTLEDILEEIIQSEIVDETDVYLDNKSGKVIPGRKGLMKDFAIFTGEQEKPKISPQLQLAVLQYLATRLDAFNEDIISLTVLKRLISQPQAVQEVKAGDTQTDKYLYKKGIPADFFVLIIQGRVDVMIGQEEFSFEEGPFTSFGTTALLSSLSTNNLNQKSLLQYVPDYSVRAISDVTYLKIPKGMYRQAVRATLMERQQEGDATSELMNGRVDGESLPALVDGTVRNRSGSPANNIYMETNC